MIINDVMFNCELSDILDEVDRQRALYGLSPFTKRRDSKNDIQVCCPYHNERRPSAGISKFDIRRDDGKLIPAGTFHCFACGETHTLPELISHCFEKYDDTLGKFGWQWLLKNFATMQVEDRKPIELNITRGHKEIEEQTYVSEEELDSYRYLHPYWAKRGITDGDIIERFDLGVDLQTNEVTMPNYDKNGNCVFVARRSIKTKYFSYPSQVEKIVYGIYQLYKLQEFPKEVYITESMIDCIYLWQFNKYACALNGLGTSKQFEDLRNMPCRKFILATDNDEAGQKARQRLRKELYNKIITEVVLPQNRKDINECTPEEIMSLEEIF